MADETTDARRANIPYAPSPSKAQSFAVGTAKARHTAEFGAVPEDKHVVTDDIMLLCRHMVAQGYEPGCPEELDDIAAEVDMAMTYSDGAVLETTFLLDSDKRGASLPIEPNDVRQLEEALRKYTERVPSVG